MSPRDEIVFVVDDDARVRRALAELLEASGWRAETFADASDYLGYAKPDIPACLILDVQLPDINGLEFQKQLSRDIHPPIVFITGYGDIPSSVSAMRRGAVDFLTKPVGESDLIAAVRAAIDRDRVQRSARAEQTELLRRWAALTLREREVLPLVVSGYLNKQAAAELGISEITLEIHRRKIMRKMQAASFADLVRIAARLQVPITRPRRSWSPSAAASKGGVKEERGADSLAHVLSNEDGVVPDQGGD
jgi:FixJ family two-component response regulator